MNRRSWGAVQPAGIGAGAGATDPSSDETALWAGIGGSTCGDAGTGAAGGVAGVGDIATGRSWSSPDATSPLPRPRGSIGPCDGGDADASGRGSPPGSGRGRGASVGGAARGVV